MDTKDLDEIQKLFDKLSEGTEISHDGEYNEALKDILGVDVNELEKEYEKMMTSKTLLVKRLNSDAVIPKYNYETDSGFDFHSTIDVEIGPFGRYLIPTGLSFRFDIGYEIQVRTKSGLAINQGIMVLNSPGTVDQGYSGEIKVPIFNANPHPITINKGMKVAQGVLCPVMNGKHVNLKEVNELPETDRGNNGFGSTGIQI
jgi:dUTP pyrophosphatase